MKTLHKIIPVAAFLVLMLLAAASCRKAEPYVVENDKVATAPNISKPLVPPSISPSDLQFLNTFSSDAALKNMKIRSSDEVFGLANDRSYAYNEFNYNRIVYYLYGGKSDNEIAGRWFNRIILQWDPGTHSWKVFFNDGIQYFSRLSDDIALRTDAWYYTLQWVWDAPSKKWIKFDVDLLVHT